MALVERKTGCALSTIHGYSWPISQVASHIFQFNAFLLSFKLLLSTGLLLFQVHRQCVRVFNTVKVMCNATQSNSQNAKISYTIIFFRLLTPALNTKSITIAITKTIRLGKSLFRKRSDKMRKELEDAAREGSSRRSNSPVPAMPPNERTNSLSDLTGAAKAAGFYSDSLPKNIHLKFVCVSIFSYKRSKQQVIGHHNLFYVGCTRWRSERCTMESC